ncbi:MAG: beta-ketoacyl synthase N-terminal-like domain-containing protein [Pseudomonadota bacterium]|nr:beta-ketoacyl synthase N-terminal-like domain-containing protein [Pseudomonadota bacterium]
MENTTKRKQLSAQITGFGWVTAAGWGRGRSGGVPLWEAGDPQPPTSILQNLHGGSRFGRLDLFSQIGVAAVALALEDAGHQPETKSCKTDDRPDIGLVCATTSSCKHTDHNFYKTVQDNPRLASPGLFVYTLATSFLGEAALRFAITGSSLALIEPQPSGGKALRLGLEQLNYGDEDVVITGICNLFEKETRRTPFFSGALFLVLEKEQDRRAPFCGIVSCNPKENGFYYNDQACTDILSLIKIICKK